MTTAHARQSLIASLEAALTAARAGHYSIVAASCGDARNSAVELAGQGSETPAEDSADPGLADEYAECMARISATPIAAPKTGLALLNEIHRELARSIDTTTVQGCRDAWREARIVFAKMTGADRKAVSALADHFDAKADAIEYGSDELWDKARDCLVRARREARGGRETVAPKAEAAQ